jgi:hypothetical protein
MDSSSQISFHSNNLTHLWELLRSHCHIVEINRRCQIWAWDPLQLHPLELLVLPLVISAKLHNMDEKIKLHVGDVAEAQQVADINVVTRWPCQKLKKLPSSPNKKEQHPDFNSLYLVQLELLVGT